MIILYFFFFNFFLSFYSQEKGTGEGGLGRNEIHTYPGWTGEFCLCILYFAKKCGGGGVCGVVKCCMYM